jgi:osmotically-inducible protein OsmY
VVDSAGHLAGIISRADVLNVYARPDEEIRREVSKDVLLRGFLVDPSGLGITVEDGVVTVSGRPETGEVGRRIIAAVRHVDGVVAVRDHLAYSDQRPWAVP